MNRCPSCRTLVPASWIACRRCGAALPVLRAHAGSQGAPEARAGAVRLRLPAAPDTLLPGRTPDNLLPGRTRDTLLPRRHTDPGRRQTLIVAAIVVVMLAVSGWTAARVVFTSGENALVSPTARDRRAEALLRDAADAARTVFMQLGTYEKITPAAVEDRARAIPIVGAGVVAHPGEVSIRASDDDTLVLATPGAADTCVFAHDEPTTSQLAFAVASGKPCAAGKKPRAGWSS